MFFFGGNFEMQTVTFIEKTDHLIFMEHSIASIPF